MQYFARYLLADNRLLAQIGVSVLNKPHLTRLSRLPAKPCIAVEHGQQRQADSRKVGSGA